MKNSSFYVYRLFAIVCLTMSLMAAAQNPNSEPEDNRLPRFFPSKKQPMAFGDFKFWENKGQWEDNVLYRSELNSGTIYLEEDRVTYFFLNQQEMADRFGHSKIDVKDGATDNERSERPISGHAYRINFRNANRNVVVQGFERKRSYSNFFLGNDPSKWQGFVKEYGGVKYKNIYPNIDYMIYGYGDGLKYDFVVHPKGEINEIALEYEGVDDLFIEGDKLIIKTSVADVEELAPYAYQVVNGKKLEVKCNFRLKGRTITYEFPGGYDGNIDLVIDPILVFSSFSGAIGAANYGFTATHDLNSNFILAGTFVWNASAFFPVTVGAYDTVQDLARDMVIEKFDSTGQNLEYATFLGSSSNDVPHSLIVDNLNNLIVMGTTGHQGLGSGYVNNFPITPGAYDNTFNGGGFYTNPSGNIGLSGADIIMCKLDPTGSSLLASTYMGGSNLGASGTGVDGVVTQGVLNFNYGDQVRGDIAIDAANNVYVASCARSSDFPTSATAYQPSISNGTDAVIFKLNPTFTTLMASTFLGGAAADAAYSIELDPSNNVVVCGGTRSADFPTTSGAHIENMIYTGPLPPPINFTAVDGFISVLSNDLSALISSTRVGTDDYDQAYFLDIDPVGDIYVYGQTKGNLTVSAGVYSEPNGKQFVQKFSNDLTTPMFTTVFGSGDTVPDISPTAFMVSDCNDIYLSGWGSDHISVYPQQGNTLGLTTTSTAFRATTDGSDFYLMVLHTNAQALKYATFFGSTNALNIDHVDGGTSRFQKNGTIYQAVCAACDAPEFMTTPGAAFETVSSVGCRMAAVKFAFPDVISSFVPDTSEACIGTAIVFTNYSENAQSYIWDFDDGFPVDTNTNPTHTFIASGTYNVTLYAFDSTSCNVVDSFSVSIEILDLPNAGNDVMLSMCPGGSLISLFDSLGGAPDSVGTWLPTLPGGFLGGFDPSTDTAGVYEYIALGGVCPNDTAGITITFIAMPDPGNNGTASLCENSPTTNLFSFLGGSPDPGGTWSPVLSGGAGLFNPALDTAGTYMYTHSGSGGCPPISANVEVIIDQAPDPGGNGTATLCSNGSTMVLSDSLVGSPNLSGAWSPTISGTSFDPAIHGAGVYIYTVAGSGSCADSSATVVVSINTAPAVTLGPPFSFCQGDSLPLDAGNPGSTFVWTPGGETTQTINASLSGDYSVEVTDANGCQTSDTILITETPLPSHGGITGGDICIGQAAILVSSGVGTLIWGTSETNDTIVVSPIAGSWYYSTYSNTCGSSTDSIYITVNPAPVIIAGSDTVVGPFQDVPLWAIGGVSYVWSPPMGLSCSACPNPTANLTVDMVYYVTGTDANGCVSIDTVFVKIDGNMELFVANVFSPNGDGLNDELFVRGGPFIDLSYTIYNRWGEKIFDTDDQTKGWDGTHRGKPVDPGVFVYKVIYTDWKDVSGEKAGNVTLIK